MKSIHVNLGADSYDVVIENGLLDRLGPAVRRLTKADKIAVVTDDTVDGFYGERLEEALRKEGFDVRRIVFPAGEESKNIQTLMDVYAGMADFGLTRSDMVIAFGGGVPGDLGGFAAATYLRGVPFIQIPTTIISQVDSSAGGKVGIDLPSGKNQAGAFYQPKAVFIDPLLLGTLSKRFIHDGLAEVIKYGCIKRADLFELLEANTDETISDHWEEIIQICIRIKADLVEQDVFDTGDRMILNYGHTIGHAIERHYGFGHYTHGEGVAAGMSMITERTEAMGLTEPGTTERLRSVIRRYGLPVGVDAPTEELLKYISKDKKKRGKKLTIVTIKSIGDVALRPIEAGDMGQYIRKEDSL